MVNGDGPFPGQSSGHHDPTTGVGLGERPSRPEGAPMSSAWVIETIVSPFHCLYQDALEFHQQSHLRGIQSEAEGSRLARAALLLYLSSAEALVHQAAVELGRPELQALISDPSRPLPLTEAWKLLPVIATGSSASGHDPEAPPWPQFSELIAVREAWTYPGQAVRRRAYYRAPQSDAAYEPLQHHEVPPGLHLDAESLVYPRTGLPRDPYALRARHLDTVRGILDAVIDALDRRLGGALTRDSRHRREPVRVVYPR
jgi:hypothetical protein